MTSTNGNGTKFFQVDELPSSRFKEHWDSIVVEESIKQHLLNYARTVMSLDTLHPVMTAANRLLIFAGAPGVGKTSLARGFADRSSRDLWPGEKTRIATIQMKEMFDSMLGGTMKKIAGAFDDVKFLASQGNVFVLADEIETLAFDRTAMAKTNDTIDQFRGVNSLLTEFDSLVGTPNVLIIGTTNQPDLGDSAVLSRADLIITFELPCFEARVKMIIDKLNAYRSLGMCLSANEIELVAELSEGLSGRDISKMFWLAPTLSGKSWEKLGPDDFFTAISQLTLKNSFVEKEA